MNNSQFNQLNGAYNQAWNTYQNQVSQISPNLSPQTQQAQQAQLYSAFQTNFNRSANGMLADPTMRQRFDQLGLQYQGYGAFNDPNVQRQLGLTAEQQAQLNQYNRDFNSRFNAWNNQFLTNRDSVTQQWNEGMSANQRNINGVLTPMQNQAWSRLTGQPYNFSPDMYFGGTNATVNPQ
jgi:hypothetical protein